MKKELIKSHEDLAVYQMAFDAAMKIFYLSKKFSVEERYCQATARITKNSSVATTSKYLHESPNDSSGLYLPC